MDDLGKDRGQNLLHCRRGCAPRSSTQQIVTNCSPLLASEKEKFLYFRNKNPSSALALELLYGGLDYQYVYSLFSTVIIACPVRTFKPPGQAILLSIFRSSPHICGDDSNRFCVLNDIFPIANSIVCPKLP